MNTLERRVIKSALRHGARKASGSTVGRVKVIMQALQDIQKRLSRVSERSHLTGIYNAFKQLKRLMPLLMKNAGISQTALGREVFGIDIYLGRCISIIDYYDDLVDDGSDFTPEQVAEKLSSELRPAVNALARMYRVLSEQSVVQRWSQERGV